MFSRFRGFRGFRGFRCLEGHPNNKPVIRVKIKTQDTVIQCPEFLRF